MNKLQREHVVCDLRGSCKQEKKLCRTLPQISGLTNRQIQVLKLIGRGLLNKEIAAELGISLLTVISHTKNIRDRKNLFRKSDLALYAQQLNLIGEDQTLHTRL
ncbi:response regulator transcription factor [Pedobacter antarcticus]|uniref:response regulator transcription factor n=1 Tax=Pedobacter antarcticus TaxID=34086 RepID=UPI003CC7DD1D